MNKIGRITTLVFGLLLWTFGTLQAQGTAASPYSRFGLGTLGEVLNAQNRGMAGITHGLIGSGYVHGNNPATYIYLDSMSAQFNFDVSMKFGGMRVQGVNGLSKTPANDVSIGSIALTLPIVKGLRMSLGLQPVTQTGYNVKAFFDGGEHIGRYERTHEGNGGVNKLYVGFGFGSTRISGGVNIGYNFGYYDNKTYLIYNDTVLEAATSTEQNQILRVKGFAMDLGFQYRQPLNEHYQMALGLSYSLPSRLSAHRHVEVRSIGEEHTDSIYFSEETRSRIMMPSGATIGLSLRKDDVWMLVAEYRRRNYAAFGDANIESVQLKNSWTTALGAELMSRWSATSYWGQMCYRGGLYYGKSHVALDGRQIDEYGITIGVGLPIRRSFSRIDLAFEYGRRGSAISGQIQEDFFRFVLGVKAIDFWFMKRKFD